MNELDGLTSAEVSNLSLKALLVLAAYHTMSAAQLRQRRTYNRHDSDDEGPVPVLDEEEQEQVLSRLRQDNASSFAINSAFLCVPVVMSLCLQLQFLFDTKSDSHPLVNIFHSPGGGQPLIPLAKPFTVVHVALHLLALAVLTRSSPALPINNTAVFLLSNMALAVCFVLRTTDFAQLFWWAITSFIMAGVVSGIAAMKANEESIRALDKLKYDVKGA